MRLCKPKHIIIINRNVNIVSGFNMNRPSRAPPNLDFGVCTGFPVIDYQYSIIRTKFQQICININRQFSFLTIWHKKTHHSFFADKKPPPGHIQVAVNVLSLFHSGGFSEYIFLFQLVALAELQIIVILQSSHHDTGIYFKLLRKFLYFSFGEKAQGNKLPVLIFRNKDIFRQSVRFPFFFLRQRLQPAQMAENDMGDFVKQAKPKFVGVLSSQCHA